MVFLPPRGEVDDCGDEEGGAEDPEEDRDGRPAADDAGCNVGDLSPDGDQGGAVGGVLVQEQGEADACADTVADGVDVRREEEGGGEESGKVGSCGYGHFNVSFWMSI